MYSLRSNGDIGSPSASRQNPIPFKNWFTELGEVGLGPFEK